jgi:glycerate kinase
VVTAEGFLDEQSFDGKVVGGVAGMAAEAGVPCLAVVGEVLDDLQAVAPPPPGLTVVSLVERYGDDRARTATLACIEAVAAEALAAHGAGRVE